MRFNYLTRTISGFGAGGIVNNTVNRRKPFSAIDSISFEYVQMAFNFAYAMSYGRTGAHRDHRSGGINRRRNGEIFANTFIGKLSEFAIYQELCKQGVELETPDLNVYGLGKWDSCDFKIFDKLISIKSTKTFGNLLLLETKDWTSNGMYIPNGTIYDFTILVRIADDAESIMKRKRVLYTDIIDIDDLWELFCNCSWEYDVPGFITNEDLIYLISQKYVISQGEKLNGSVTMDANNYYCQTGDMRDFSTFLDLLEE